MFFSLLSILKFICTSKTYSMCQQFAKSYLVSVDLAMTIRFTFSFTIMFVVKSQATNEVLLEGWLWYDGFYKFSNLLLKSATNRTSNNVVAIPSVNVSSISITCPN